jgi:predicted SprT family Zn-dependent metalloprotease
MRTILDFLNDLDARGFDVYAALDAADRSGLTERPVKWNTRLRTTAGRADMKNRILELNPRLRMEEDAALHSTFIHELAHLIAGPGHGHDYHWSAICRQIGGKSSRCHQYESMRGTPRARKHVATCAGCGFELMKARRLTQGRTYRHRRCGGTFVPA